ncbi:tryptophan-rich sensory protein [bacterium]|nr:tryptophan-rich sensory protein [bacterium]MCB2178950.1 tryptophan-rich sensory protein [bacterium]
MKRTALHRIITVLMTTLMISINALANIKPINGQQTGEISDRFDVYFVPAGYVFSIWGLIYLGMIAYTIFQALPSQRYNTTLKKIDLLYWISCAANSAWIVMWHYEYFPATMLAMVVILVSLIGVFINLKNDLSFSSGAPLWFATVPFSIYLGWISVATIANASQLLVSRGWDGWGIAPDTWAAIMIVIAGALGIGMALRFSAVAYNLVLIWAFIGIAAKHSDNRIVFTTVLLGVGLSSIGILVGYLSSRRI